MSHAGILMGKATNSLCDTIFLNLEKHSFAHPLGKIPLFSFFIFLRQGLACYKAQASLQLTK